MSISGEIIAIGIVPVASLEVVSTYNGDPLVVTVSDKHLLAIGEEIRGRKGVILEDNSLFHILKEPGDSIAHRKSAADVTVKESVVRAALPVGVLDDLSC